MSEFTISRKIAIDAGHRIATHGSKCRHLHGHHYEIEAMCRSSSLRPSGEQTSMVLDFGFLKAAMIEYIDQPCDHGLILAADDREALAMLAPLDLLGEGAGEIWLTGVAQEVAAKGFLLTQNCRLGTKLYVIAAQPTAEALAQHWFERLEPEVERLSDRCARLEAVIVQETPNCSAEYRRS